MTAKEDIHVIRENFNNIAYPMVGIIYYMSGDVTGIRDVMLAENHVNALRSLKLYWEAKAEQGELMGVERIVFDLHSPTGGLVLSFDDKRDDWSKIF